MQPATGRLCVEVALVLGCGCGTPGVDRYPDRLDPNHSHDPKRVVNRHHFGPCETKNDCGGQPNQTEYLSDKLSVGGNE